MMMLSGHNVKLNDVVVGVPISESNNLNNKNFNGHLIKEGSFSGDPDTVQHNCHNFRNLKNTHQKNNFSGNSVNLKQSDVSKDDAKYYKEEDKNQENDLKMVSNAEKEGNTSDTTMVLNEEIIKKSHLQLRNQVQKENNSEFQNKIYTRPGPKVSMENKELNGNTMSKCETYHHHHHINGPYLKPNHPVSQNGSSSSSMPIKGINQYFHDHQYHKVKVMTTSTANHHNVNNAYTVQYPLNHASCSFERMATRPQNYLNDNISCAYNCKLIGRNLSQNGTLLSIYI